MDHAQGLFTRESLRTALEKFWRAHIVDDDPYDALETERLEALIRAAEERENRRLSGRDSWLAA